MVAAILKTLSRDQNSNNTNLQILVQFLHLNTVKDNYIVEKGNGYCSFSYITLHLNGCYFSFCNCEGMTSFPHSLVLDIKINISYKLADFHKNCCKVFVCLSYKVHVKVCDPIHLKRHNLDLNVLCLISLFFSREGKKILRFKCSHACTQKNRFSLTWVYYF